MRALTNSEIKQVNGGQQDALKTISSVTGFFIIAGFITQGVFYNLREGPTLSSTQLFSFFAKPVIASAVLGIIIGTLNFLQHDEKDSKEKNHSSACI